jgi:L-alanine-DL-glutamate epimerase-like enolase superfamily enzyme
MKIEHVEVLVLGDRRSTNEAKRGYAGSGQIEARAFLRIRTSDGIDGIAEMFEVPPKVAVACLDGPDSFFGAHLVGQDPNPPKRLWRRLMGSQVARDRAGWAMMCIGAVEVALWDIVGKSQGRPVHAYFGGPEWPPIQISRPTQRSHVTPYATVYALDDDPAVLIARQLDQVAKVRELGYRAVKVEPLRSSPATIVEMTRRARELIGPDCALMVDVGFLWNEASIARRVVEQIAEFDITWFETPFPVDKLGAYRKLSRMSKIPIAAGEFGVTAPRIIDLMDVGGVDVLLPYVTTAGGFGEVARVVDAAAERGAAVCPGGWGTPVTTATHLHVATWSEVTPYFEYPPPEIYDSPLRETLAHLAGIRVTDGLMPVPVAPGIGIELTDDVIARFRVK